MRSALILAACVLLTGAQAPYLDGAALQAEVTRNCSAGCIVYSPEEILALQAQINAKLYEREKRAFEAGMKQGNLSCRNAV